MRNQQGRLIIDLAFIFASIVAAVLLIESGAIDKFLTAVKGSVVLGSFIAGIFFVSVFTIAPATAVFVEIAQSNSLLVMAFWGGIGALIGDLLIFYFVKDRLADDFSYLTQRYGSKRLASIFKLKTFRWLTLFLGALIVASPLPDEIGLAMMGLSKAKAAILIPVSFVLNSAGILAIGLIATKVF